MSTRPGRSSSSRSTSRGRSTSRSRAAGSASGLVAAAYAAAAKAAAANISAPSASHNSQPPSGTSATDSCKLTPRVNSFVPTAESSVPNSGRNFTPCSGSSVRSCRVPAVAPAPGLFAADGGRNFTPRSGSSGRSCRVPAVAPAPGSLAPAVLVTEAASAPENAKISKNLTPRVSSPKQRAACSTPGRVAPAPGLLAASFLAADAAPAVDTAATKSNKKLTPRVASPRQKAPCSTPVRGSGTHDAASASSRIGISTPGWGSASKPGSQSNGGVCSTPAKGSQLEEASPKKRRQTASVSPPPPRSGIRVAAPRIHSPPIQSMPLLAIASKVVKPRLTALCTDTREAPPLKSPSGGVTLESVTVERTGRRSGVSEQHSPRDQILFRKSPQGGAESSVRVAVRFRPWTTKESIEPPSFIVRPGGSIVESSDLSYSFELDRAFGSEVTQAQVYSEVGQPAVADVLNGYNGTILAYGQTGSGKTHCMFGPPGQTEQLSEHRGLIPRAARQVFDTIRSCVADDISFVLRCSLLEVYLEQLRDLLDPLNRDLHIQETPQRGIYVDGLTQEPVTCEEDVFDILRTGEQMRMVACTKSNELSSRSHVIFMLSCTQRLPDGSEKVGKLSLADLAGSERVAKSGALAVGGIVLQEATKINGMLSALGHVIQALVKKQSHVPYRNSQLTRVLQETLGGNCKTALVVTCSAMACHAAETLSSLRFATRARLVRNHVKVNLISSPEQLSSLVVHLQRDLAAAHRQAAQLGLGLEPSIAAPLVDISEEDNAANAADVGPQLYPSVMEQSPNTADRDDDANATTQAVEEQMLEINDLEFALMCQDEQVKALILASPPQAVERELTFLGRQAWVNNLTWRLAMLQCHEQVALQKIAEAEAQQVTRCEQEFEVACEHGRHHRLLVRRNDAQSAALNSSLLIGEMSMLDCDPDGAADSTDPNTSLHCQSLKPRRRSYISALGRRASKVVCPISRRSIGRRSVGSAMSPLSSHSATPGASPRGNGSPLAETLDRSARIGSPVGRIDACMVDEEAQTARGHAAHDVASEAEANSLRRQIAQMREAQNRVQLDFEEQQQRKETEFLAAQAMHRRDIGQLEEDTRSSAFSYIQTLHNTLERADLALAEAEADDDALQLELLRQDRLLAQRQLRLSHDPTTPHGQLPELDIDRTCAQVSFTLKQLSQQSESARVPTSSCKRAKELRSDSWDSFQKENQENQLPVHLADPEKKRWPYVGRPRQFAATIQ